MLSSLNKTAIGLWSVLATIFLVIVLQINYRIASGHSGDFRHFYFAAGALLDHRDLYGPVPLEVVERGLQRPAGPVEKKWYTADTERYLYPPMIAMAYTPIARLKFDTAQRILLLVNASLILVGILLVTKSFSQRFGFALHPTMVAATALLGTVLNVDKIHLELQMFQTNALMFFMFGLTLYLLDRKPIAAGIPLGVIFNIKYLSLGMLPWLIFRRRWATAISCVVSTIVFAFLPAMISGWKANLHHLGIAYGGLLRMLGISAGNAEQAHVDNIRDYLSCSITSAMARTSLNGGSLQIGMLFAGCIALLAFFLAIWIYHHRRLALFNWPPSLEQIKKPWSTLISVEFVSIVAITLCLSPQTNTRHLMLMLLLTIGLSAMIVSLGSWAACVGAIVLAVGFIFPPGGQAAQSKHLSLWWFGIGGQCWCLLFATFVLIWVGSNYAKHAKSFEPVR